MKKERTIKNNKLINNNKGFMQLSIIDSLLHHPKDKKANNRIIIIEAKNKKMIKNKK